MGETMRRAMGPAGWRRHREARRYLRAGRPRPAVESGGGPARSERRWASPRRRHPGEPSTAHRRRGPETAATRRDAGPRAADRATGTPASRSRRCAVARSAPRCGHAPRRHPKLAVVAAPGDDRHPATVAPQAFAAICELAANAYQLPLGRRCARASAARMTAGFGIAVGGRLCRPVERRKGLERPGFRPLGPKLDSMLIGVASSRAASRRSSADRPWLGTVCSACPARPKTLQQVVGGRPSGGRGALHQRHRQVDTDSVTRQHQPADPVSATVGPPREIARREPRTVVRGATVVRRRWSRRRSRGTARACVPPAPRARRSSGSVTE